MYTCICGREFEKAQGRNGHYRYCLVKREGRPPKLPASAETLKAAGQKGRQGQAAARARIYEAYDWERFSIFQRRKKVLEEQNGKCLRCGIDEWQGEKIVLEMDHIDGNHFNNERRNLRILCPNCHSLTPTHRFKKRT